jgi:hypothetical protein
MRKRVLLVFIVLVVIAGVFFYLYKCTSVFDKLGGKNISEGVIEYDITYPKLDPNSMMVSGMPNKAYLRFKDNNMSNDMSGMMGLISITYVSNAKTKAVEQRLTLINKKYASEIKPDDLKRLNDSYVVSVEDGKTTKQIAGFNCKEALVKVTGGEEVKIYYTNEIGIDNPNWSNPYTKIGGVLMDFQMERYGVAMHLKAKSVLAQKVDDSVFSIPADSAEYKMTPFSELEKILQELNPN